MEVYFTHYKYAQFFLWTTRRPKIFIDLMSPLKFKSGTVIVIIRLYIVNLEQSVRTKFISYRNRNL